MTRFDRLLVPAGWAALSLPLLLLFVLSVPAVHERRLRPTPAVSVGLSELRLSAAEYAAWWTAVVVAFALVCFAVAGLIVARRPRERAAWFASLFLVSLGGVNAPNTEALVEQRPELEPVATAAFQLMLTCLVLFLFTFPDGRFVPRWSAAVVAVAVTGLAVARGSVERPVGEALFWALLLALGAGVGAQVHRYRRVSTSLQRQQTRWVTVAVGVAVVAQLLFPLLESVPALTRPGAGAALLDMASPAGISLAFSLVPLALALALLRSRLWDLDVVVNRALVGATVTVGLLALYLGVVAALGRALGAIGGSLLAAAVVALALAPVRDRTQQAVNRLMYGQRDEPYRVLSGLGQRLEDVAAPDAALQTVVDTVASALRSPHVAVVVHEPDGTARTAACTGAPVAEPVALSLVHRHQAVGELHVAPRSPSESFGPADRALLADLARQAGAAVHAVQLAEELQHSRERLVMAREEERRRLRRDLHDGLGPALASMTMQAEAAQELLREQPETAAGILRDLVRQLSSSTVDVRRLVYGLRPPALDDLGLVEALRRHVGRVSSDSVQVRLQVPEDLPPLSAAAEVAVYRIVQEAVVNVLRHARATSCEVTLSAGDTEVSVAVRDDGCGIDAGVTEGIGLRSMRERSHELGGSLSITGTPGAGTCVQVTLPRASRVEAHR